MSNKEWWTNPDYYIGETENTCRGITRVVARLHENVCENVWEYAIVRWQHCHPVLVALFQGGIMSYSIDD